MNILRLKVMLMKHEGKREKPYRDTVGRVTIGVGRNLDAKGLRDDEIALLLTNDVNDTLADCAKLPWFGALSEDRQLVVADMIFNMGLGDGTRGFMAFAKMIEAIQEGDYDRAASEMLASKWAMQVGQRAQDLAKMMRAG